MRQIPPQKEVTVSIPIKNVFLQRIPGNFRHLINRCAALLVTPRWQCALMLYTPKHFNLLKR